MENLILSPISLLDLRRLVREECAAAVQTSRPAPVEQHDFLTVNEAVRTFKTSKVTLWKARREGRLPALMHGRKVLFRRSDLENLLTPVTC